MAVYKSVPISGCETIYIYIYTLDIYMYIYIFVCLHTFQTTPYYIQIKVTFKLKKVTFKLKSHIQIKKGHIQVIKLTHSN